MDYLFWISLSLAIYTYVGYPVLVLGLGRLLRRRVAQTPCEPTISIIIAARNEAARIAETVENKRSLVYPQDKLQIIVVSDASSDGTDDLARRAGAGRALVLRQNERQGKTAALNLAARHATGDVLVFADANSMYAPDALRMLVRNFSDPSVGYVTGRLVYGASTGTGFGCSMYMAYEDLLRRAETAIGSIVGVNGGIDAVRRSLYVPMNPEQLPDFVLPLHVVRQGYRVVYEPDARLSEDSLETPASEYRMRVRVALRAWWTLSEMRALFDPRRYGVFSLQLLSHKVLRYAVFLALAGMYVAALGLWPAGLIYRASAAGATVVVAAGLLGYLIERSGRSTGFAGLPYYFILINAAAAHALLNFLRGRRQATWTPRLG